MHFLGYGSDLPPIAAATDVAVLSSANEGTPVSLIEAAAAGRPAVATDVGGVSEVVRPESGILCPPENEDALSSAMARLATESKGREQMGDAARRHALTAYSADRLLDDIDAVYGELLRTRRL